MININIAFQGLLYSNIWKCPQQGEPIKGASSEQGHEKRAIGTYVHVHVSANGLKELTGSHFWTLSEVWMHSSPPEAFTYFKLGSMNKPVKKEEKKERGDGSGRRSKQRTQRITSRNRQGHRRKLWGQSGRVPPIIEKRPCFHQLLKTFPQ